VVFTPIAVHSRHDEVEEEESAPCSGGKEEAPATEAEGGDIRAILEEARLTCDNLASKVCDCVPPCHPARCRGDLNASFAQSEDTRALAVCTAAREGNAAWLDALVSASGGLSGFIACDVDGTFTTPLEHAALSGHTHVIEFLLLRCSRRVDSESVSRCLATCVAQANAAAVGVVLRHSRAAVGPECLLECHEATDRMDPLVYRTLVDHGLHQIVRACAHNHADRA
jgi:hypothetical protein